MAINNNKIPKFFFTKFSSLFIILLFHLTCFIFHKQKNHTTTTISISPFKKKLKSTKKTISSFINRIFTSKSTTSSSPPPPPSMSSPSSSTRSMRLNNISTIAPTESENYTNIFPCSICGEIFIASSHLNLHQSSKHPIADLIDGENILRIIFNTGWPVKIKNPNIHRILKIHNSPKITAKFDEYREIVKSRASSKSKTLKNERCIADGNELLRFHCTTFICDLDSNICNQQYCSVCGIIKNGFSPKMDGISTMPTSWSAHLSIPADLEDEFGFMNVKRALLVCRVIAGRVGCDPGMVDKEDPGFDSLMGGGDEDDELVVFNPRAVLPCFVIVYTV